MKETAYKVARRTYGIAFRIAFAMSVLSFLMASLYTQFLLSGIDEAAETIETVASPSIDYLLKTRESLDTIAKASTDYVAQSRRGRIQDPEHLQLALENLKKSSDAYLNLQLLPDEEEKWLAVDLGVKKVTQAIGVLVRNTVPLEGDVLTQRYLDTVQPAIVELSKAIPPTIAHDAGISQRLAEDIRSLHQHSLRVVIMLDAMSLILSVLAAIVVYLLFRRHARLEDRHISLQSERVEELSIFAGRVAHDIKNPLSTIAMGLEVMHDSLSPADAVETIELTQGALKRGAQLVDGLLEFARAGSNPMSGDHANIQQVLTEVGAEYFQIARRSSIDFSIETLPPVEVGCSAGILVSIFENLLRNAIKYMGDSETRRIIARAQVRGENIHVEIEDSGPGIPEEIQDNLFEPFVRGSTKDGDGVGLGLATVKRLVEAYGGSIGVLSMRGTGSSFWFELPLVSA